MGRREEWVRIGATVLILAVLAFLFLRDRSPEEAPHVDDPEHTVTTPTDVPEQTSSPVEEEPEAIPSPPEGLAELVCEQFRVPVDLRVLSFNTHRSTGTLNAIAEEILQVDPDVVLLQEVDRKMLRTGGVDQAEVLADAVGMDGSFSSNLVRGAGQYGTLILSRFDIVQQGRIPLVRSPRAEARGLQWVTVEVSGQAVRVYNTHLDATRPDVRLAQARQVAGILAADDVPTILGGDLNAWPASAAVAVIGTQLTDTWTAAGQGRAETSRGGKKIDYVFVRGLRPLLSQVAASGASDHNRLWVDLRLRPPDRCGSAAG
jgi:endonuclease/exonuclease/phosphatase family metal-dependent hydrolase